MLCEVIGQPDRRFSRKNGWQSLIRVESTT
jgi:hypothetical protein